jgi:DNA primase
VLRPLSPSVRDSLEMATAAYQKHLDVAEEYLAGRGISRAIAESHRLGVAVAPLPGHERMVGRLAIPYLGRGSVVSGLRFRSLDNGDPKYLGLPGVELRLFNVRGLHEAGDTIHITEGELDAISLTACDLHAVGVPGVNAWPEPDKKTGQLSHHHRLFAGFSKVFIWGDGDDPGREFAQRVAREIDTAIVVPMPEGMDVNSLLVRDGPDVIRAMVL